MQLKPALDSIFKAGLGQYLAGRVSVSYAANPKRNSKVLDFIQLGGPILTVDRTIFEMRLGDCKSTEAVDPGIVA